MNDATLQELKIVVERAVRPVRATLSRKRRMREELLAHLTAIFEEEIERRGDTQAALEQAKRRFGDPSELTGQLQQAVPRCDRYRSLLENIGCRPGESAYRLAIRQFLAMLLFYSLWLPIWLLLVFGKSDEIFGPEGWRRVWALVWIGAIVVTALHNVLISVILAPLLNRIGRAFGSSWWRRLLLAGLSSLVAICGLILPALAGVALVTILMAYQAVKQRRYQTDWA